MNPPYRIGRFQARAIRAMGEWLAPWRLDARGICILTYHRILESHDPLLDSEPDIQTFRWQMQVLAECFHVMPLHEAIAALAENRVPPRAVCVTFDDGYRTIHELALPVLKEFKLPATVFVTTGHMESGSMWNDKIIDALRTFPGNELNLQEFGLGMFALGAASNRKETIGKLIEASKYLQPTARFELVEKLARLSDATEGTHLMLTRDMVRNLAREGIEIGGHTVSHPILTCLDDAQARHEISTCKNQLEEITEKPVRFFAYPNGKFGMDFDERHVAMAKEAGYLGAFTTAFGAATHKHDRYQLPRSRPWDKTPFLFALRLLRWLSRPAA